MHLKVMYVNLDFALYNLDSIARKNLFLKRSFQQFYSEHCISIPQ